MRSQHSKRLAAVVVIALGGYSVHAYAQTQTDAKASGVMAAMRKALGGEQKLANVKGLSLRADYRREMSMGPGGGGGGTMVIMRGSGGGTGAADGGQMTGKIEIDLELPDKYLRSDIGSSGFAMTRTEGFEGTRPFIEVVPNSPGMMQIRLDNPAKDPDMAKRSLRRNQADAARLLLGLIGGTQPGFDVSYTYGGLAESPDGKADIIDVSGAEEFKVRLFVDTESHLPLMLTYMDAEPRVVMSTFNRGAGPGERRGRGQVVTTPGDLTAEQRAELEKQRQAAEAEPPRMVEYRLYFSDYRKSDGISLPYHISRGTAAKTTEEWDVTSYKVNPSFKADRFKVGS
jgi:hypothetical protein